MTLYFEGRILPVTYLTVANLTRPIILAGFSTCSEGQMVTQSRNIMWQMVTQPQVYLRTVNPN